MSLNDLDIVKVQDHKKKIWENIQSGKWTLKFVAYQLPFERGSVEANYALKEAKVYARTQLGDRPKKKRPKRPYKNPRRLVGVAEKIDQCKSELEKNARPDNSFMGKGEACYVCHGQRSVNDRRCSICSGIGLVFSG